MYPYIYSRYINDPVNSVGCYKPYYPKALGVLSDCYSCTYTRERNGENEIEFTYPIDGIHYDLIVPMAVVGVTIYPSTTIEGYLIYKITKNINMTITVNAFHISYLLKYCTVNVPYALSNAKAQTYIDGIINKYISKNPDRMGKYGSVNTPLFQVGYVSNESLSYEEPKTVREIIGGSDNSFLDRFGGDWDDSTIYMKHYDQMGADNGLEIKYGKNMTSMTLEMDYSGIYTACIPYWKNGDTLVKHSDTLSEDAASSGYVIVSDYAIVKSTHVDDYPYLLVKPLDLTSKFSDAPSVSDLESAALSYMTSNKVWEPTISLNVNFVSLSKSTEYSDISKLETLGVGDTVTVTHDDMGVSVDARVEKIEFNVLADRPTSIQVGNKRLTLADVIKG